MADRRLRERQRVVRALFGHGLGPLNSDSELSDAESEADFYDASSLIESPSFPQLGQRQDSLRARTDNTPTSPSGRGEPTSGSQFLMPRTGNVSSSEPSPSPRSSLRQRGDNVSSPTEGLHRSALKSTRTGMRNTSVSSLRNFTDGSTGHISVANTTGNSDQATQSGFACASPPLPPSNLIRCGSRAAQKSPVRSGSSLASSPRRARLLRRNVSGSENSTPCSLSKGGVPTSLYDLAEDNMLNTEPRLGYHASRGPERDQRLSLNNSAILGSRFSTSTVQGIQRQSGDRVSLLSQMIQRDNSSSNRRPHNSQRRPQPFQLDCDSEGHEDNHNHHSSDEDDEERYIRQCIQNEMWQAERQGFPYVSDKPLRRSENNNITKRSRDKSDLADGNTSDIMSILKNKGAVSAVLYRKERPQLGATDVWPDIRDNSKAPSRYFPLCNNFSKEFWQKRRGSLSNDARPAKITKLDVDSSQDVRADVQGWPRQRLPTEMFEEIASYLSRDDVKSMRLVSREFDKHVSQVLFRTVVVPFNTEIYGMLGQSNKPDFKGKGKAKVEMSKSLSWKNANGDDVYDGHGLDVFRGFGPYIRKYGMSFDVDEDALAKPPYKGTTEKHSSFWGNYDWPFEEYRRFDDVAGLESAADETPKMKTAFSMLQKVQELALSLDSGLGWLKGPDRSIRARIFRKQPQVFGSSKDIPDRKEQAQQEFWEYMEQVHHEAHVDLKTATMYRMVLDVPLGLLQPVIDANSVPDMSSKFPYLDPRLIAESTLDECGAIGQADVLRNIGGTFTSMDAPDPVLIPTSPVGVLYSSNNPPNDYAQMQSSIVPTKLSVAQKEWLMETEWAQRAFLSSYMLAIMDNPVTFECVHTLNIARISSRYTSALCREDFWKALPQLKTVTILVIPDWRNVVKDDAGFVETPQIDPQLAIAPFYRLLKEMVSPRENVKKLTFGWAAGGEHAEGVHARNKHVLPAPVLPNDAILQLLPHQLDYGMLSFPHVEHLTLRNCWIPPPALQVLVTKHDKTRLSKLTLESVSLTAMPRTVANQIANQIANLPAAPGVNGNVHNAHQMIQGFNVQVAHVQHQLLAAANQQAVAAQLAHAQQQLATAANQHGLFHIGAGQPQQQHIALQIQIAHLQAQPPGIAQAAIPNLQAQLNAHLLAQAQLNVAQNLMQHAPPPPPPQPMQPINVQSAVRTQPREGSWPYVLDIISPGQNLADFGSTHSNADTNRETRLTELELITCGYVRLTNATLDETGLAPVQLPSNPFFSKRFNALAPAMLATKDPLMGEIVQEIDATEVIMVAVAWFITQGWDDEVESLAVEFDGRLRGGEGRFTGVLRKSDRTALGDSF